MARTNLMNLLKRNIESSLNSRTLRSHHHYFLIVVIKSRTDAIGIAHDERIAMTEQARYRISPVKIFCCAGKYSAHTQLVRNEIGDLIILVTLVFILIEN